MKHGELGNLRSKLAAPGRLDARFAVEQRKVGGCTAAQHHTCNAGRHSRPAKSLRGETGREFEDWVRWWRGTRVGGRPLSTPCRG